MDDDTRIGDAEREATIDALRHAVGEGRLTLDEFGERAGSTYGASTASELRAVLNDLPDADLPVLAERSAPPAPPPPRPSSDRPQHVVAVMSGSERTGTWRVASQVNAVAVMGGVKLDLYEAELTAAETTIHAFCLMGGVDVLVPRGVPVEVSGFVLMGGLDNKVRSEHTRGAPIVRVIGYGMMGGISVRHRRKDRGPDRPREEHRAPPAQPRVSVPPVPPTEAVGAAWDPERPPPVPQGAPGLDGHTVTLLFTDLVDSSGLAERLGDQRWFGVLRAHNAIVREQIARHGGEEIKAQGDGFMVAFRSARRALLAAIDIQRALHGYRQGHPDLPVHARVGLHTGEVVADDGDLYGRNVILASRITAAAQPDEVLASTLTKQLAEAGGDLGFGPQRRVTLKGLSDEWDVHTVEWA